MALRRHIFFVSEDDTVHRFPTARYDRLWSDSSARLPEYANQRVRIAEVIVECVARSPISMGVQSPHFVRFDATGALNQEQAFREAAAYMDVTMAPDADTAAKFMRRRLDHQHRWEVTPRIFANIADAVFGVGGWTPPPGGYRSGTGKGSARLRRRPWRR